MEREEPMALKLSTDEMVEEMMRYARLRGRAEPRLTQAEFRVIVDRTLWLLLGA